MTARWALQVWTVTVALFAGCMCGVRTTRVQAQPARPAPDVEQWTPASQLTTKMFEARTLVKSWLASAMPGIDPHRLVVARAAIRDRSSELTGKLRAPVTAVISNAKSPPYHLDLGRLHIGMYAIRVVAMVPTNQLARWRRPLYLELAVDDQPGGRVRMYRQRVPYWDDFYAVTEIYFNADEDRSYTATLKVGAGSEVDAYVYSIELHDVLAGLPRRAVKTRPGTYSDAERDRLRATSSADAVQQLVSREIPLDDYLRDKQELTPEQRRARDDVLWKAVLPLDTQYIAENDEDWLTQAMAPGPLAARDAEAKYGTWEIAPSRTAFTAAWRSRFALRDAKLGLSYSLDDLVAHRPLPDPYPFKDDGSGVYFPAIDAMPHPQQWMPIAVALGWWWEGSRLALAPYHGANYDRRLPYLYLATGNTHAARDAAFMLARWAYLYPALTDDQMLGAAVVAPGIPYHRDPRLRWRRFGYQRTSNLMLGLLYSYDQLFDYIRGNQELARAVGRYIPWIHDDTDLRRMIETRLVQYAAKQVLRWQRWDDKDTPTWLMTIAAIQQAPGVTRPWLDELWRRTWVYPYPVAGLPELISTTTQRDGTTDIGSVFYAQTGSPFAQLAELSHRYVENGGDKRFDLTDLARYGKLARAAAFPLEASAAGGFPLTIGDVGGAAKPRLVDQITAYADNWHRGWAWSHDPRMAWIIVHRLGRSSETDSEWHTIEHEAQVQGRDPFLAEPSRVLANWAGILEAGQESDDYRIKRAVYLRIGTGHGHSHSDTLDLQILAHGVRMAGDLGWRGGYSKPDSSATLLHDRIEVDDRDAPTQGNWQGYSWISTFAPMDGGQFMEASAVPPRSHASTRSYRRAVALVDVDAASGNSYVFDVQRIDGGTYHTWCFHGPWADRFNVNLTGRVAVGPASKDRSADAAYLAPFLDGPGLKYAGGVPRNAPLIAAWRLRRTEGVVEGNEPAHATRVARSQRNAERAMLGADYDEHSAARYLRSYLLGHGDDRVLVADPTPIGPAAAAGSTWPFLFVRDGGSHPTGAVYTAVHEPYLGAPFLASVQELAVENPGHDADRAIAIAVMTTNGRTDWLYSDGAPGRRRHVGSATVQARFALRSDDAHGLRALELVDGAAYGSPDFQMTTDASSTSGPIERIDYLARTIWISSDLPAELWVGQHVEIGNALHKTSYGVLSARRDGLGLVLTLDAPLDLSYATVTAVDAHSAVVTTDIGPADLELYPGGNAGLTLTDDGMMSAWKISRVLGPQPAGGFAYALEGSIDPSRLRIGSMVRVWELGRGDTVRLPGFVQLLRIDAGPHAGEYKLTANVGVTIRAKGRPSVHLDARQLAAAHGRLYLPVR